MAAFEECPSLYLHMVFYATLNSILTIRYVSLNTIIQQSFKMFESQSGQPRQYEFSITDSQLHNYCAQIQLQTTPKEQHIELQNLIQTTLTLQYQIFLKEGQVQFYKAILAQKQIQIKKIKEKQVKKNHKMTLLADQMTKVDKKIKETKQGYRNIKQKNQNYLKQQSELRKQRLAIQQKKNSSFEHVLKYEQKLNQINRDIDKYEQFQAQANHLQSSNQQIQTQIQQYLSQRQNSQNIDQATRKDQLKAQVHKWYEKIKIIQKQDKQMQEQYQANVNTLKQMQNRQVQINSQTQQIDSLLGKIQRIKQQIKLKKWQKNQQQNQYSGLLKEETQMKRQMHTEMQYRQNQRKIKNSAHHFRIIESEADEETQSVQPVQVQAQRSHEQFQQLVNRFQKIRSKTKQD